MKKRVLFLAFLIALGSAFTANAQLTTGVSTSKVIRTGNRAEAGNYGLYVGASLNALEDFSVMPLINLKYMKTDNFEVRVGLEAHKKSEKLLGNIQTDENTTSKNDYKYGSSTFTLYPGVAYHFSKSNILDVYAGAELPLGWNSYTKMNAGAEYTTKTTKRAYVIGLGAFVGLQAFIADLPIALGVEYGLSSRLDVGLKYKTAHTTDNKTTITYSPSYDPTHAGYTTDNYESLKARKGELCNQIRVTLSYYFK